MRKNKEYLFENGPSPVADESRDGLPLSVTRGDKQAGIWAFNATGRMGTSGKKTPVYYLPDVHPKTAVIRAWLTHNPRVVQENERRAVAGFLNDQGPGWDDAVDTVLDEVYGREFSDVVWGDYVAVVVNGCDIEDRADERGVERMAVYSNIKRIKNHLENSPKDEEEMIAEASA